MPQPVCGPGAPGARRRPDGAVARRAEDQAMHITALIAILALTVLATVASAVLVAPEVGAMVLIVGPMLASMLLLADGVGAADA
jgi:hypothetical protein